MNEREKRSDRKGEKESENKRKCVKGERENEEENQSTAKQRGDRGEKAAGTERRRYEIPIVSSSSSFGTEREVP